MFISADMNMIIQIIILTIMFLGIILIRKRELSRHGFLMFIVIALSVPSVSIVMIPSTLRIIGGASLSLFKMLVLANSSLGTIYIALGAYVLRVWSFRRPEGSCFRVICWMKALLALWILSLALGTLMFLELYY